MNERIRELWAQCVIKHTKTPMNWQDVADEFAELILQAASDHIMESSDRYRKEYFADKVLKTFDGDGEYEIGTMEGLKEFGDKRNGNGS
jgi:hypothetical protein